MINKSLSVAFVVGVFITTMGVGADHNAPTTAPAPASRPAEVRIRGQVQITGSSGFESPDLSRVVVYLASNPALDSPPTSHAVMGQQDKAFVPNFLIVAKGTDVEFPNWDEFYHNVFSRSAAAPAFDLDRYPRGQSKTRNFDKLGIVQVFCNIHPQMRATVFVVPNRFYTRADAEGRFEFTNIPAGEFEIVAWHERCDEQRRSIRAEPGVVPPDISFTLEQSRKNIISNTPPERQTGYGVERGLGLKRERLDLPVVKDAHPSMDPMPEK